MSDKKHRNPFEDHIESDAFNVDRLDKRVSSSGLDENLKALLEELPHPLDYNLWDEVLDDHQKYLCAHLVTELVASIMRENHDEELEDFNDDDLLMLLTVPVALAMIVQEKLGDADKTPDTRRISILDDTPLDDADFKEFRQPALDESDNPMWAKQLGYFVNRAGQSVRKFFRRRRRSNK